MTRSHSSRKDQTAFTLVEMLVSMAVLILIMAFVTQMMNSTTLSTSMSGRHVDTDSQAQLVFDRMAVDFARMPRRTDVDFIFAKQPSSAAGATSSGSNDKMFFYSEAPAYFDATQFSGANSTLKSSVAVTGYCINTSGTNPLVPAFSLLRLSKGLSWDAGSVGASGPGGMMFLTSTGGGSLPIPASSLPGDQNKPNWNGAIGFSPDYEGTDMSDYGLLAAQVLRLEFCFQVKDLTNPNAPGTAYSNYPIAHFGAGAVNKGTTSPGFAPAGNVGDRWYDTKNNRAYICTAVPTPGSPTWTPNGMSDVTAIVVAIAILDPATRKLVPNQLSNISAALVDPTEDQTATGLGAPQGQAAKPPHLMAETWQKALNATSPDTFASKAGVMQAVASQVRVYQRYFYLNNQ